MNRRLAERGAKRTVEHVDTEAASVNRAEVRRRLKGRGFLPKTRLALALLARDPSISYRQAATRHGVNVRALYRATEIFPEIREVRRNRQWGAR